MNKYLTAQVCLNGHIITSATEDEPENMCVRCPDCGEKTITACPSCNTPLRGKHHDEKVVICGPPPTKDAQCPNCGKPLPWTERTIQKTALIIQEDEMLPKQLKTLFIQSLPDIIVETPGTNLAIVRMKKCLPAASELTVEAIHRFVLKSGCKPVKESLGL